MAYKSPAELGDLPSTPTIDVDQFARLFGISRWSVYRGVKEGTLPVPAMRVGGQFRWPTVLVLRALGLDRDRDREPGAAPAAPTPRETDLGASELHVTPAQRKLIIAALRRAVQPTADVPPSPDAA